MHPKTLLATVLVIAGVCAGVAELTRLRSPDPAFVMRDFENTIHSQAGEDGVLRKIFEVVEPTRRFAVEFGAGDGISFSNVRHLLAHDGWGGLLVEGDAKRAQQLRDNYLGYADVRTLQAWVYPANVELLFEENGVPRDLDLLVIDIDSNDYYVWRAIRAFRPKVVVLEYNGRFAPPLKMVIGFHPLMYWNEKDFHHGASIQSLCELGKRKGYELIGANFRGINLFFVDQRYYSRFGIRDNSPATMYRPFNFNVSVDPNAVRRGTAPAPSEDLVLPETVIKKRFRFDR
jgi:hypothetical protein